MEKTNSIDHGKKKDTIIHAEDIDNCDQSKPPFDKLYTDTEEEDYDDNEVEESGEGERIDDYVILNYAEDNEDSESEIDVDGSENCASGSDVEKPDILDIVKNVKGKRFEYDANGKVHLEKDMLFINVNEFRSVLRDYVIQESFDIIRIKNEKARVTAICASDGCPWRIHASPTPDGVTFMIKTYEHMHTCIRLAKQPNATSTWIADKLKGSLNADPNMSYELMDNELTTKYGVKAHRMQLYRARKKGREESEGSHAISYKKIPKYAELLLEKNRGSLVKLSYHERFSLNESPIFKRIFVCLAACRDGFLKGCRPYFGLDGCHLKGPFGGVLLCAVSLDANNGLFPLAYAVVEVECKESWRFFLEYLNDAIGDNNYIIMSDRQKGLTQAVAEFFPNSWHRYCGRHLFNNFKAKFPLLILRELFWMAVKAPNEFIFKKAMEKMKRHDDMAYHYLMSIPLNTWTPHAFHEKCKNPHVTNNACESFNEWINALRNMNVLNLLDRLRSKIMMRFYKKFGSTTSWQHNVGIRIVDEINKTARDGRHCKVEIAGNNLFEVNDRFTRFPVNLNSHTCECKVWQLSGLPCKHGAAAIAYMRERIEDYCDAYYSKTNYMATYSGTISPLPDLSMLEEIDILPPPLRRLPGRPRVSRKKEKDDVAPSNVRRRLSTVKCANCGELGHNKRSCQRAPVKVKRSRHEGSTNAPQTLVKEVIQEHTSVQARARSKLEARRMKKIIMSRNAPTNPHSSVFPAPPVAPSE